ncbi:Gp19/Gp15/Gp42 family protein [Rhodococcus globerulus]|uniref:Gp19/Gp15/Gp42 family protein n=1 Tax=Rhodococcus globerulus TaxID=33008 RepID=UPI001C574D79|nr:Gp19/Gp15/Gp42 family protein [Rhodococcus globerulus]QXW04012.1 hypothetical protein KYT97_08330 [Rhodococcus globerulus]
MTWTVPQDVLDRWIGTPPEASEDTLKVKIADAEDDILRADPNIQDRIDSGALPTIRVVKVVARMLIRHLQNPEGFRSVQQGAGPFQQSQTFGGDEPGALTLTDDDREELGIPKRKSRAFSIDMTPPGAYSLDSIPAYRIGWC